MGTLFGTDGIRGVAGSDLTAELAHGLGGAAVVALADHGISRPTFVVGRDPRASGEFLEAALVAGITSAGGDVVLVGQVPTPAVAHLTTELEAAAGVMISASHNPAEYNGFKFFSATGFKLPDEVEDEIEALVAGNGPHRDRRSGAGRAGWIRRFPEAEERYLAHLTSSVTGSLDGMRVLVDCANGAASRVAPELLRRLGATVTAIHDRPDGRNINRGSGATVPEVAAFEVLDRGADAGVAHDGDGDRAMFVDHRGSVVDGDQVLAACALAMKEAGTLDGDVVVTTVMANLGLRLAMGEAGIRVLETRVGDRYVLEAMLEHGAVLGGEQSGHIIFRRHATTGDGLLTAARFLTLARATGRTVEALVACMRRYPQVLRNVEVDGTPGLVEAAAVREAVARAEDALGAGGRVLVRASGTEPLVRVMVEAATQEDAARHADDIAAAVRAAGG